MALKTQLNLEHFGVQLPEAYIAYEEVRISRTPEGDAYVLVLFAVYSSEAARHSGLAPMDRISVEMHELPEICPVKAAYASLKQDERFADAIDV